MSAREWICKPGQRPKEDSRYFENMTRMIFQAGLNWKVINRKWPAFHEAFAGFEIDKVTKFTENDVQQLLGNRDIVRNEQKIRATIYNAHIFQEITKEADSFSKYLTQLLAGGLDHTIKELKQRFKRLGEATSKFFLWSVGVDIPHPNQN